MEGNGGRKGGTPLRGMVFGRDDEKDRHGEKGRGLRPWTQDRWWDGQGGALGKKGSIDGREPVMNTCKGGRGTPLRAKGVANYRPKNR